MSKDIKVEMGFSFEQYTAITCRNVKCRHNRRYLGDLHCNYKHIVMTEEGKCYYMTNREE